MSISINAMLAAATLVTLCVTATDAATIHVANNGVDGPGCGVTAAKPCRSIGKGLAAAANGDTVEVGPGLYGDIDADGQLASAGDEQGGIGSGCDCMIHVTKTVRVVSRAGATQTLIHPGPADAAGGYAGVGFTALVQIDAAGAVFGQKDRGFTVSSRAVPLGDDGLAGIRTGDLASAVTIRGNFVTMNKYGIFTSSPAPVVEHNLIQTNTVGVIMEGGHGAVIASNAVQGNNVGLGLLGLDITVTGNIVTGNRSLGITLHGGTGFAVTGNSVLGNGVGVLVGTQSEAAVHGNNIFGNDTVAGVSANAGMVSNSALAVDATDNYWGTPAASGFAGDSIYNLGTGSLASAPVSPTRFAVALQPMK